MWRIKVAIAQWHARHITKASIWPMPDGTLEVHIAVGAFRSDQVGQVWTEAPVTYDYTSEPEADVEITVGPQGITGFNVYDDRDRCPNCGSFDKGTPYGGCAVGLDVPAWGGTSHPWHTS